MSSQPEKRKKREFFLDQSIFVVFLTTSNIFCLRGAPPFFPALARSLMIVDRVWTGAEKKAESGFKFARSQVRCVLCCSPALVELHWGES